MGMRTAIKTTTELLSKKKSKALPDKSVLLKGYREKRWVPTEAIPTRRQGVAKTGSTQTLMVPPPQAKRPSGMTGGVVSAVQQTIPPRRTGGIKPPMPVRVPATGGIKPPKPTSIRVPRTGGIKPPMTSYSPVRRTGGIKPPIQSIKDRFLRDREEKDLRRQQRLERRELRELENRKKRLEHEIKRAKRKDEDYTELQLELDNIRRKLITGIS